MYTTIFQLWIAIDFELGDTLLVWIWLNACVLVHRLHCRLKRSGICLSGVRYGVAVMETASDDEQIEIIESIECLCVNHNTAIVCGCRTRKKAKSLQRYQYYNKSEQYHAKTP